MALIKLDAGGSVLALSFHRVIADRSSVAIFVRELSEVYLAKVQGRRCALPELWLQFGDFAAWQRHALEGVFFKQQLGYWRRQLAPMPASLKLPRNYERPATRKVPNTAVPFLEDEYALKNFNPQAAGVQALDKIGCIISSPSASSTAAFRFFAPRVGIQEDRASGSVIPALVAYWGGDRSGSYVFSQESGHNIQIQARQFGDRIGVSGEVLRFASGKLGRIPVTSSLASSFTFQSAR
jgi:hypothetical protein